MREQLLPQDISIIASWLFKKAQVSPKERRWPEIRRILQLPAMERDNCAIRFRAVRIELAAPREAHRCEAHHIHGGYRSGRL
jgi:hypothetical protein